MSTDIFSNLPAAILATTKTGLLQVQDYYDNVGGSNSVNNTTIVTNYAPFLNLSLNAFLSMIYLDVSAQGVSNTSDALSGPALNVQNSNGLAPTQTLAAIPLTIAAHSAQSPVLNYHAAAIIEVSPAAEWYIVSELSQSTLGAGGTASYKSMHARIYYITDLL